MSIKRINAHHETHISRKIILINCEREMYFPEIASGRKDRDKTKRRILEKGLETSNQIFNAQLMYMISRGRITE